MTTILITVRWRVRILSPAAQVFNQHSESAGEGRRMINLRKAIDRGVTRTGWLESHHSFSFGNYFDSRNMGFGDLRVINEDFIKEGTGFGTHSHRDMEIITYVLSGAIQHRDSTGG